MQFMLTFSAFISHCNAVDLLRFQTPGLDCLDPNPATPQLCDLDKLLNLSGLQLAHLRMGIIMALCRVVTGTK